ncbi:MAG: TetR/AcrR family transcriptional regulator [Polyangiales bacterium]
MPRKVRTAPRRLPSQRRGEDTVTVLLDATERVLAREGWAATTTNKIADVAGVSIGTLYHYFPTKEALVEAVVHRMWRDELEALRARAMVLGERPLDEAIGVLVRTLAEVAGKKLDLYRRWYGEASNLGQLGLGLEMTDEAVAMVRAALELHRDRIRPKDLDFAADLVVKTAMAVVRTATRDYREQLANGQLAEELADMITRYLLR